MEKTHATESPTKRTLHKRSVPTIDVSHLASQAGRYVSEARRFARERPGTALGLAFGAGMIFGGSIVNRLVRLAVYSALGAGVQALIRQAPEWIERFEQDDALEAPH
jgi:hypothetical protein